jgi:hypothetical protein
MSFTDLTVQNGGTYKPDGYLIQGTGTCTVDAGGALSVSGGDGNTTSAAGANGISSTSRPLGRGTNATASTAGAGTNNSTNVTTRPQQLPTSGATSGAGGVGGSGAGGAGGLQSGSYDSSTLVVQVANPLNAYALVFGAYGGSASGTWVPVPTGRGGTGAGGNGAAAGTGGGGSGGMMVLAFSAIVNNGSIESKGGNTGNAVNNNSGTGGGGGGGMIFPICNTYTGTAPDVSGGTTIGTPLGTGTAGTVGQSGYTYTFIV